MRVIGDEENSYIGMVLFSWDNIRLEFTSSSMDPTTTGLLNASSRIRQQSSLKRTRSSFVRGSWVHCTCPSLWYDEGALHQILYTQCCAYGGFLGDRQWEVVLDVMAITPVDLLITIRLTLTNVWVTQVLLWMPV